VRNTATNGPHTESPFCNHDECMLSSGSTPTRRHGDTVLRCCICDILGFRSSAATLYNLCRKPTMKKLKFGAKSHVTKGRLLCIIGIQPYVRMFIGCIQKHASQAALLVAR
jgi:hypothetical protein